VGWTFSLIANLYANITCFNLTQSVPYFRGRQVFTSLAYKSMTAFYYFSCNDELIPNLRQLQRKVEFRLTRITEVDSKYFCADRVQMLIKYPG